MVNVRDTDTVDMVICQYRMVRPNARRLAWEADVQRVMKADHRSLFDAEHNSFPVNLPTFEVYCLYYKGNSQESYKITGR